MARKAQSMSISGFIHRTYLFMTMVIAMVLIEIPLVSAHEGGGSDNSGGDNAKPNLRAKGLILVKIWCLIIVFAGTFVGGISPYFFRWNESFLLVGTQFAGGVFLATALMHFLSDSASTFNDLTEKTYPFAFMLCTAGYLFTMLGDLTVEWVTNKQPQPAVHNQLSLHRIDIHATDNAVAPVREIPLTFQEAEEVGAKTTKAPLISTTSFGDTLMLILALCFHSVFEGIAVGVAETKADAWRALWTVCLHKIFAAIAMGIALLQMKPNRPLLQCAAYSFAFAISSPIGVAIGILIDATTQGAVADWIYAISMGLACGIFVYVAINHLLAKGIINTSQKKIPFDKPFYKFMAVVVGATVIAVVMIWD